MDGQTGLKLDDNWEIICPWAQIMIGTSMPVHITENMIELTDEILERKNKEDYGEKSHVITDLIYKAKNFNKIKLLTNGLEKRQFLFVDECSEALYTIMINHDADPR